MSVRKVLKELENYKVFCLVKQFIDACFRLGKIVIGNGTAWFEHSVGARIKVFSSKTENKGDWQQYLQQ